MYIFLENQKNSHILMMYGRKKINYQLGSLLKT